MNAPDWYDAWKQEAVERLHASQQALDAEFRFGAWERYDYDLAAASLLFSEAGQAKLAADIQAIGTTSQEGWLWAWANDSLPAAAKADVERVRAFGAEHGIDELTSDYLVSDDVEMLGWSLTAVAARVLEASGAYRPQFDDGGALFLVCRSVRLVS